MRKHETQSCSTQSTLWLVTLRIYIYIYIYICMYVCMYKGIPIFMHCTLFLTFFTVLNIFETFFQKIKIFDVISIKLDF